jgi:membrane protease YdiL (CAAX protease family)
MQRERTFRILVLLLSFGSIATLAVFFMTVINRFIISTVGYLLPHITALASFSIFFAGVMTLAAYIPVFLLLLICAILIAQKHGKAAGAGAILACIAFILLSVYVPYFFSIALSIAFLSVPFLWDSELQGKSMEKTMNKMGIKREGFVGNAILGVATTLFLVGPLIIIEAIILVLLLHIDEPGKVSMIMGGLPWYILVFSFTIGPIAEEVFFRSFLVDRVGVVISTLLFALAHYSYRSWTEFFAAFTAGFIFALLYRRRKSVIPSIFAHAAFNFINVAMVVLYYWFHVVK